MGGCWVEWSATGPWKTQQPFLSFVSLMLIPLLIFPLVSTLTSWGSVLSRESRKARVWGFWTTWGTECTSTLHPARRMTSSLSWPLVTSGTLPPPPAPHPCGPPLPPGPGQNRTLPPPPGPHPPLPRPARAARAPRVHAAARSPQLASATPRPAPRTLRLAPRACISHSARDGLPSL